MSQLQAAAKHSLLRLFHVQKIVAAQNAFAAIRTDGRVVTWGALADQCADVKNFHASFGLKPFNVFFSMGQSHLHTQFWTCHGLRIFTEALSL